VSVTPQEVKPRVSHKRRFGPVAATPLAVRTLADCIAGRPLDFVGVAGAGWAAAFGLWAAGHAGQLMPLLFANQLPADARAALLRLLLIGSGLALVVWLLIGAAGLLAARRARIWLERSATLAPLIVLPASWPVLALPGIEADHPFFTCALVLGLAALAFVAVNRAGRVMALSGQWPEWAASRIAPARAGLVAAWVLALGYAAFFSVLTLARHRAFLTHSFDLGIHDQALFTLLRDGYMRSTQYSATAYGTGPINYIADHFSPIFYLVAPLYALWQDAASLLVLQSVLLGLGAVPVYLIARRRTGSIILSVALAAAFILYPAQQGVNTFDFHQIALVTPLLLWALYFLDRDRLRPFLVFLALALMTKEEVGLTVAAFGIYLFFARRRYGLGAGLAAGGALYFVVVVGYVMPALGGIPQVYRFGGLMAEGYAGLPAVARTLLTNPLYVLTYIITDPGKLAYLAQLLVPVAGAPLLAGAAWILAVPALAVALLGSVAVNYSITTQYSAIVTPFIFFMAAIGLARLDVRRFSRMALAAAVLVAGLGMNYEYGWLYGKLFTGFPQPTPHQQVVTSFFAQIPHDASVSTLSDILPHLSNRENIYLFPAVNDADYIFFDNSTQANFWPFIDRNARHRAGLALAGYLRSNKYGVVRADDWCLLLKRGYDPAGNAAALALLNAAHWEAEDLHSNFSAPPVADPSASGGRARMVDAGAAHEEGKDAVTFGPYTALEPGRYRVSFLLKTDQPPGGAQPVATVDVFSTALAGTLGQLDVRGADFTTPGAYQSFSFEFTVSKPLDDVEYRVMYHGPGRLWADAIDVTWLGSAG
jgi:uncharacterized membrane protein